MRLYNGGLASILLMAGGLLSQSIQADVPSDYYKSLEGKSGDALFQALHDIAYPSTFHHISYGSDSWEVFATSDIRMIGGEKIWWDMYSNVIVPVASGHSGLNIEHCVANSWFGKKEGCPDAFADLFHLTPSNEAANNQKSDNPLGEVATVAWQNGLVKIGAPKKGEAGSATKVFEPADEYKGDFARAYFYIFTAYPKTAWKSDQAMYSVTDSTATLQPWAAEMLLRWAMQDPVDDKEIDRNNEIFKFQQNRNPFIDHPELAEYIWGEKKSVPFTVGEAAEAINRPADPVFTDMTLTGVNTYTGRWWESEFVEILHNEGNLWVSLNGGEYQQFGPGINIPSASSHGETLSIAAYTEMERDNHTLRSSIARLTLTGINPDNQDFTTALWKRTMTQEEFSDNVKGYFIIRSTSNHNIMSHEGGTSSSSFMADAGSVKERENGIVETIPANAAIIKFELKGEDKYLIEVYDALHNKSKGYWNVGGSGNKNTLKPSTGTAATVDITPEGEATITFEGGKVLQYNASQPRFTNYAGTQKNIYLSHNIEEDDLPSGIGESEEENEGAVGIDGNNILLPAGWRLYGLNGREYSGYNLEGGIYIARSPKGKAVKILIGY